MTPAHFKIFRPLVEKAGVSIDSPEAELVGLEITTAEFTDPYERGVYLRDLADMSQAHRVSNIAKLNTLHNLATQAGLLNYTEKGR